jgi:hypothetical protein
MTVAALHSSRRRRHGQQHSSRPSQLVPSRPGSRRAIAGSSPPPAWGLIPSGDPCATARTARCGRGARFPYKCDIHAVRWRSKANQRRGNSPSKALRRLDIAPATARGSHIISAPNAIRTSTTTLDVAPNFVGIKVGAFADPTFPADDFRLRGIPVPLGDGYRRYSDAPCRVAGPTKLKAADENADGHRRRSRKQETIRRTAIHAGISTKRDDMPKRRSAVHVGGTRWGRGPRGLACYWGRDCHPRGRDADCSIPRLSSWTYNGLDIGRLQ